MTNAGFDYTTWSNEQLVKKDGWEKISDVDGGVFLKDGCVLSIYVDDGLISGPRVVVHNLIHGVRACLSVSGEFAEASDFLQLEISRPQYVSPTKVMRTISQENYTRHVLENYKRDAGISGPLKRVLTPAFDYEYTKELEAVPGKFDAEFGRKHVGALLHLA